MGAGQSKLTLEEQQKENKQMMRKAIRELNREKNGLERQEKKTVADIKIAAKKGNMSSVKIMAKDLVRNRKYQTKFMEMASQLQGVQLKMRTMQSSQQMAAAMKGVSHAMAMTTKNLDMPELNKIMQEFQRETEKMDIMDEMIGDSMDVQDMEDEEATEELVSKVLDEIGVELGAALASSSVPTGAPQGAAASGYASQARQQNKPMAAAAGGCGMDDDLQARLDALKK